MKKLSITWTKDESCCYILVINPWAIPDFNGFGFIAVQSSICWLNKSSVSLGSSQTHVHILDTGLGAWRPGFPVVPDTVSYQQYLGLRHGIFLTQDTSEELLEAFFFRFLGILDYLGWWTALLSNVRKAGMLRLNSKYLKIITWITITDWWDHMESRFCSKVFSYFQIKFECEFMHWELGELLSVKTFSKLPTFQLEVLPCQCQVNYLLKIICINALLAWCSTIFLEG